MDVLTNFRYAYVFKDSLIYSDLLDSNFKFISKNYSTTPPTDIYWGRDVDIKTTMGMFRHFETLNLIWDGTIYSRFINEDQTLKGIKKTFSLTLTRETEIFNLRSEALFVFRKRISYPSD